MDKSVLQVSDSVKWIGILDNDIVTFDIVMETHYGTTYNSYFIDAEKKTIIDTAKETYKEDYLNKIRSVVDPSQIEVIVINHTEPDHSGCIRHLLSLAPKAKVYGSRQAINYLGEIMNQSFNSEIVKDGDTLSLGNKTLRFIGAPNLHWPDTIYTYLEEEKILFTCDSFGAHYCNENMFDDEVDDYEEYFKYYFDIILKPFSKFMLKAIEKIEGLDISVICPGHGPILRSSWKDLVQKSKKYAELYLASSYCEGNNVLITYVSAYGFTKKMAEQIAEGIREKLACDIKVVDIENIMLGELEEMIVRSNALLIGSPTINQNTVLSVYKLFSVINPIRDKGKKAAAFGSYGWSGEAVKLIEEHLQKLKLNIVMNGMSSRFAPGEEKAEALKKFGHEFAEKLLKQ
ncbi:MAG: FprA family A-type flavoprotein [Bacteroidales bacterium]|nr:FprA family A-type flavoprotein [Bacteroidales bacterium]